MSYANLIVRPDPSRPWRIVIVARISTTNQDPTALAAQIELCKKYIRAHFKGPWEFIVIATQGSGEILDRSELAQLEDLIANRKVDIVIAEDLGRIMRRMQAYMLCEACDDNDVRLIAINDRIDTGEGDWQLATIFAAMKHERSNADTSARIARQLDYNFMQGACLIYLPPGIVRPEGCKSDVDLRWDPQHAQYFRCVFFWYERGWSICRLVRFLRSKGITINNKQLRRLLSNTIFIGERRRGMTLMHRKNRSGRRERRVAGPSHLKVRPVPHLAIIDPKRFARVQALLKARGEKYVVGHDGRPDNRKGRPRKQTAFPGQRVQCAVCGRIWYWGGHGQAEHMSCSGERQYKCWVTATFDGNKARQRICAAVVEQFSSIEPFDVLLRQTITEEAKHCLQDRMEQRERLTRQLAQHQRDANNLLAAVRAGGGVVELLVQDLAKAQAAIEATKRDVEDLDRAPKPTVTLPTAEVLGELLKKTMNEILAKPGMIGEQIDRLLPSVLVYPVRTIDGGPVVLRARVEVNLAALITVSEDLAGRLPALKRVITVDLFDPPERVRIRPMVLNAQAATPGATLKWIAANVTHCTATAVQRTMELHRAMVSRGLADPYVMITEAAHMTGRNRKHTRDQFEFEPLPGFPKLPTPKEDDSAAA